MKTSVIVTTYNWPEALRLCIQSFEKQTYKPSEVIIADDGSKSETAECIARLQTEMPFTIKHAWQEDDNFRAARARNLAVKESSGDYLIFVDGDIIAHPHFIEDHLSSAKKGVFLQGGRCLMSPDLSESLMGQNTNELGFFTKGILNRKNALRLPFLSPFTGSRSNPLKGIRTCNLSLYRSDFESINGFDNRFVGWGREDSEFAARLKNNNIKRKDLRFKGLAYHIFHEENSRQSLKENHERLMKTINESKTITQDGFSQV